MVAGLTGDSVGGGIEAAGAGSGVFVGGVTGSFFCCWGRGCGAVAAGNEGSLGWGDGLDEAEPAPNDCDGEEDEKRRGAAPCCWDVGAGGGLCREEEVLRAFTVDDEDAACWPLAPRRLRF